MAAINISYKETTAKRVTTISLLSLKLDSHLQIFKVGLSPSKKNYVVCLIKSPLKIMENAFYFNLKAHSHDI